MKSYLGTLLLLIAAVFSCNSLFAAESAEQVLKKTAAKVKNAGGISASFSMNSGGQIISGTLKSSGNRFAIETGSHSTWYDGKTMWTYSKKSAETTVTTPTPGEVAEANPVALVNSYSGSFTAQYAKSQPKGSKTIVLTPKTKSMGLKSVHVTISDASGLPTQIVMVPSSGTRITVSVTGVKTGQSFAQNVFTYPKSKYPKAEIIDLR